MRLGSAAKTLGAAPISLRRKDLAKLWGLASLLCGALIRMTLAYARVSSHDQKVDLVRQVAFLESFCVANGWTHEVLQDLVGLGCQKKDFSLVLPLHF